MKSSLVPVVGALVLVATASHAASPAQRAKDLDVRLKSVRSLKKSAELILTPKGYKTDADYSVQSVGNARKIVALSEGESRIEWTIYFERDKPFYAILTEEGRNGARTEYISFSSGAFERVSSKSTARVALSSARKKFLLETARRFLAVAQSK